MGSGKTMKHITGIIILSVVISFLLIQGCFAADIPIPGNSSDNLSQSDQEFLFFMTQYWIPDLYEIKGRIDGAYSYDITEMQNLSLDYARVRLDKNLNESQQYQVSPDLLELRRGYQLVVNRTIGLVESVRLLNRSDSSYPDQVSMKTAPVTLYGSWLEYQVMKHYSYQNRSYPDIVMVPPEQFFSIMDNLTAPPSSY